MTNAARQWRPIAEVWEHFCTTDPNGKLLGLKGNENSLWRFYRKHGKRLEELGVARRSPAQRRVIVDERFELIVFDLLTLGELPDEAAVAAA